MRRTETRSSLRGHTTGHEAFAAYVTGARDGTAKTHDWAASLADVSAQAPRARWESIAAGLVMLPASWSLQRAEHGEHTYWALIAPAAILGQVGLPAAGFGFCEDTVAPAM